MAPLVGAKRGLIDSPISRRFAGYQRRQKHIVCPSMCHLPDEGQSQQRSARVEATLHRRPGRPSSRAQYKFGSRPVTRECYCYKLAYECGKYRPIKSAVPRFLPSG
jgi:hypothetical protein